MKKEYFYDTTIFKQIDSPEKAYWLGFLYADGNLLGRRVSVGLANLDAEHVEKFKRFLGTDKPIEKYKNSTHLQFNSKEISDDLRVLGLYERKSLTIPFPTTSMVPDKYLNSFVLGYFDGDGTIYKSRRVQYSVKFIGSNTFIDGLKSYLTTKGFLFHVRRIKSVSELVTTDKKNIREFYKLLYSDGIYCLQRKKEKFETMLTEVNWERVDQPRHSRYKYVTLDRRRGKWVASRKINRKTKFIGYFDSEINAHLAAVAYQPECLVSQTKILSEV